MAERRRIIPASVGPLFQPKEEKSWKPAVRFELTLDEPNDTKCSEYSYRDLYKKAVGEVEGEKSFNDLEEEDISGLAALAKKFEEKYGTATEGGKKKLKKRDRLDDLMDVGMGYDETDPFVDNSECVSTEGGKKKLKKRDTLDDLMDEGMGYDETDPFVDNPECYDELVPSILTTQLGGFYINQGQLNFREISDSEDDDDFIHAAKSRKKKTFKTPNKKKRKSSFEEKERKRRKQEKKAKKQLQKQFGSKKKKVSGSPTVAELLKRQTLPDAPKSPTSSGKLLNGNKDNVDPIDHIDPSLDLGISDFKMDSDMAKVMEEALASIQEGDTLGGDEDSMGNGNMMMDDSEQYVKCPENIPPELMNVVGKIKDAATKSREGKCKFFTPSVNQLLLRIELQTRDLTCGKRSQLFSHMAAHLPCGKETLLKRAKKLRLGAQDVNVKEPLQKLREAIAKVMPENIQRHHEECQTHALEKATRMAEGKDEGRASDDDEDKKSKQGNFGPRKKFQWTDEIRKLLCEAVSIKMKTFEVIKSRSQSAEEYVRNFLDNEVKPLWPQGWIQTRMLYKETRSVHGHLTANQPVKPKKVVLATKKSTFKKPNNEGTPNQMSVASMITQAIMSPNSGNSNQSTPVSEKGTPTTDRVPTLLDYANSSAENTPSPHQRSSLLSNQSTPTTTPTSSSLNKNSTHNTATSLQQNSDGGVSDFTASFMEKLIADELAASSKTTPTQQTLVQKSQVQRSQPSPANQSAQLVTKPKTSPPQGQPQSIQEIVAATAKAMATTPTLPQERQASSAASVLQQLSTHAQNNTSNPQTQMYITSTKPVVSKPTVVRKLDTFGSGQERLKKLSLNDGKPKFVNIPKQRDNISAPSNKIALSQTIQKLSSNLASSRVTTTMGASSSVSQSTGKPTVVVSRVTGSVQTKQNTNTSSGAQSVVRLQRPPTGEKVSLSSQPQIRLASTKSSAPAWAVTKTNTNAQPNTSSGNSKATVQPVRTALSKQPKRVIVQTLSKEQVNTQVSHLNPANLQAGMGNIFANLSESMYGTSVSKISPVKQSSKELPYYAAATSSSGNNSHPKPNQMAKTHGGYRQQSSPTSHPVHVSSYSPPTKVTKQQALSGSQSAFTAPSPPKLHKQPSTSPTLSPSPSTSPVGQKYPAYVSQRTSPSQTSPKYPPASYPTAMAGIPGYQQLSLADLTHKQAAAAGYTQGYTLTASQGQGSAATAGHGSPGDAIITGPAPGTFYHQAAATGSMLGPMQSPTEQPYHQLPPWAQ